MIKYITQSKSRVMGARQQRERERNKMQPKLAEGNVHGISSENTIDQTWMWGRATATEMEKQKREEENGESGDKQPRTHVTAQNTKTRYKWQKWIENKEEK